MSTTTSTPILCCQCGHQLAILEQLPVDANNQLHCSTCGLGMVVDTTPAPADTTTAGS